MTSMCLRCNNFTLHCTCAKVTTSGGTTALPQQHYLLPKRWAFNSDMEPYPLVDEKSMDGTAYVNISPADFAKIRALVHEEIAKALQDEEEEEDASPIPLIVRLTDKPTMHVKFQHDGVLYEGEVFPVEEKYV